jgi:hypothetical protein
MDIEKRIRELDVHLKVIKLYANSYYNILPSAILIYVGMDGEQITDIKVLINRRLDYKKEKVSLYKKIGKKTKIRKDK